MESQYTWLNLGKGENNFMDIMAAPIHKPSTFLEEISKTFGWSEITLCIGGELKTSEEGKPASNFRYEKDEILNENVIENYNQLFHLHQEIYKTKPIFVTTIPRNWRKYSWLIQEDGKLMRKDQDYRRNLGQPEVRGSMVAPSDETARDKLDEELTRFLSCNCIKREHLIKLRECCKGARYHTYLADMISFLYQLRCNINDFSEVFYPEYRKINVCSSDDSMNTLSFEKTMDKGCVFLCPKRESVEDIYHDFQEAISLNENSTKEKIRNHLRKNKIHRWTDFSANDTDDAFTILMMIHAFNGLIGEKNEHGYMEGIYYKPTEEENNILDGLYSSLDNWRKQLN